MSRNLKITIRERAGASSRPASDFPLTGSHSDPGTNYVMPPPEDPGTNYVMPPPEDPGTNYVMPPPEDPSAGSYALPSNGGPGALDTVVTVSTCDCGCGCTCGCKAPAGQQTGGSGNSSESSSNGTSREYSGFVIVRLAAGIKDQNALDLWILADNQNPKLNGLKAVLELPIHSGTSGQQTGSGSAERQAIPSKIDPTISGASSPSPASPQPPPGTLVSRPLVELQGPGMNRALCLEKIGGLETQAATSPFPPLHSLTAYWRVDLRQYPDLVEEVVKRFNALAEVDLAYRELTAKDPGMAGQLFADDQGYLSDAPVGISAAWARQSIPTSTTPKLTICDLEQGWILNHEALSSQNNPPFVLPILYGANRFPQEGSNGFHGTAVLGQLAATGSINGAASGLCQLAPASHYKGQHENHPFAGTSGHVAAAIVQALTFVPATSTQTANLPNLALKAGDILLLEVQRSLLPTEVDEADFDAIRLAAAQGVTVVEAAGNGGTNLDAYVVPETGRSLSRSNSQFGDSGAILVGAARAALPHDRAPFSNYGSRLDCFGWGETVTTCGFGDLAAGTTVTSYYTNSFNGTSSASPIVAGAAALVQALYNQASLSTSQPISPWLDPRALRTLLSDPTTGTRQGPNVAGFIGVMPDLRAIVRRSLGLVADIYMRRFIGDDGSRPAPDDEISSSPDILIWKGPNPQTRFGEGVKANIPAPGTLLNTSNQVYPNDVYVRLRNRGGSANKAKVQLFASPAATLITPERWLPLGFIDVPPVPPGDTLVVSGPLSGQNLPSLWSTGSTGWASSFTTLWTGNVVPHFSLLAIQVPPDAPPDMPPQDLPAVLQRPMPLPPGPPYFDWAKFRAFLRDPGVAWRNSYPVMAAPSMTLAFLMTGTPDSIRHFDFEVIQRLPAGAVVTLTVPDALAAKLRQRQPALVSPGGGTTPGPLTLPKRPRTMIRGVELAAGACSPAALTITVPTGNLPLATGHSLATRQIWKGEEVGRITWWFITQGDQEAD